MPDAGALKTNRPPKAQPSGGGFVRPFKRPGRQLHAPPIVRHFLGQAAAQTPQPMPVHRDGLPGALFGAEGAVDAPGRVVDRVAAGRRGGGGRRRRGRAGEGFAVFGGVRRGVAGQDAQALFGADLHAVAALDAVEPVDGPAAGGPVHRQCAGRAAAGAQAAADAVLDRDFHMAAHPLRVLGRGKGIVGGHRRVEQVVQRRVGKGEKLGRSHGLTSRYS